MKKLIINILITGICLGAIFFFGIKEDYGFIDTKSNERITLTNTGNVRVELIEGVSTSGSFLSVENGKSYDTVVLNVSGEILEFEDFSFSSETNAISFALHYDAYQDNFYMDRTYLYLNGYNTVSLAALIVLAMQAVVYIAMIMSQKSESFDENVVKMNGFDRLTRSLPLFFTFILAVMGLFVIVEIFVNLQYFIYSLSDTLILIISGIILVVLYGVSIYLAVVAQNHEFIFESKRLVVKHKNAVIFESSYEDLVVEERVVQTNGVANKYTNMTLILKNDSSKALELNLLYMGYDRYDALVKRLHKNSKGQTHEDERLVLPVSHDFVAKKQGIKNVMLIIIGLLMFTTVLLIGIALADSESIVTNVMMIAVLVIVYVIVLIRLIVGKYKPVTLLIEKNGVRIDDAFIDGSDIKMISMTRPTVSENVLCNFVLKSTSKTYRYTLKMKHKKQVYSDGYRHLYLNANQFFSDILK